MDKRPFRRSVLASAGTLALAGLAGCTSGDESSATSTGTTRPATTAASTTATDETATPTESAPSVDWDEVAEFRTWLTDYSTIPESNHRFDYQAVGLDNVVGVGRTAVFDLAADDVDGALVQSANIILLGEFDVDALVEDLEASADHEVTGEYEGYRTAETTESGSEVAVGDDAVLAGSDLSVWIDTHLGERERLETIDPVFTRIFERLPERGLVTAQYGTPVGGEIDADAIAAWGHSLASLEAETGTWVYALEPDTSEAAVDELEAELGESAFTNEVTDRTTDGRFVTFTATMADLG